MDSNWLILAWHQEKAEKTLEQLFSKIGNSYFYIFEKN